MPADFNLGGFARLRAFLASPRALMERIAAEMASRTQESFERGGHGWRGGDDWAPRATPNVPGILNDMKGSPKLVQDRLRAGPVLVDTGRLMGSITGRSVSDDTAEYGTNVHYAPIHHFGRAHMVTINKTQRANLRKLIAKASTPTSVAERMSAFVNSEGTLFKPKKRPIVVYEAGDTVAIQDVVDDFMREMFR